MTYKEFLNAKKSGFQTRSRNNLLVKPNGRSTDWIVPSFATGCELACSYCYVARHRSFGNPLEQYTNVSQIWDTVEAHWRGLPVKVPNQCDPKYWTYDIGESTDCLSPANIDITNWFISKSMDTNAKLSFATKLAGTRGLIDLPRRGMTRVRVSLAPQVVVDKIEKATSKVQKRIEGINKLYELGYEVHINFSPIVVYDYWKKDYINLLKDIDKSIDDNVKKQVKCEVIFLTHHEGLSKSNNSWIPEAEELTWKPEWQEGKTTQRGDNSVVRYKHPLKNKLCDSFVSLMRQHMPYCEVRYIF